MQRLVDEVGTTTNSRTAAWNVQVSGRASEGASGVTGGLGLQVKGSQQTQVGVHTMHTKGVLRLLYDEHTMPRRYIVLHFTYSFVVTSHETNACSRLVSQVCLCIVHDRLTPRLINRQNVVTRDIEKTQDMEKVLVSYDITTDVRIK